MLDRLRTIGAEPCQVDELLTVDCWDAISADYMIEKLGSASCGTLVVVDYL